MKYARSILFPFYTLYLESVLLSVTRGRATYGSQAPMSWANICARWQWWCHLGMQIRRVPSRKLSLGLGIVDAGLLHSPNGTRLKWSNSIWAQQTPCILYFLSSIVIGSTLGWGPTSLCNGPNLQWPRCWVAGRRSWLSLHLDLEIQDRSASHRSFFVPSQSGWTRNCEIFRPLRVVTSRRRPWEWSRVWLVRRIGTFCEQVSSLLTECGDQSDPPALEPRL